MCQRLGQPRKAVIEFGKSTEILKQAEEENDPRQYLEEMTKTAQAGGGVDDESEVNDNKVSTSDVQFPSQLENVLQGIPVYNGTEESQEIEVTAPGHLGSDASDPNGPVQELSENMQSENALQNASTLAVLSQILFSFKEESTSALLSLWNIEMSKNPKTCKMNLNH